MHVPLIRFLVASDFNQKTGHNQNQINGSVAIANCVPIWKCDVLSVVANVGQTDGGSNDEDTGIDRIDPIAHLPDDFPLHFHLLQVRSIPLPQLLDCLKFSLSLLPYYDDVLAMHERTYRIIHLLEIKKTVQNNNDPKLKNKTLKKSTKSPDSHSQEPVCRYRNPGHHPHDALHGSGRFRLWSAGGRWPSNAHRFQHGSTRRWRHSRNRNDFFYIPLGHFYFSNIIFTFCFCPPLWYANVFVGNAGTGKKNQTKSRSCANGFTSFWNTRERQCSCGCLSKVFSCTTSSRWWSSGPTPTTNFTWCSAGAFPLFWRPSGPQSQPPIRPLQRKFCFDSFFVVFKRKKRKAKKKGNIAHGFLCSCWLGYNLTPFYWILEGPRLTIIFINLLYLLNILRVLVTKLRNSQCSEAEQLRYRCLFSLRKKQQNKTKKSWDVRLNGAHFPCWNQKIGESGNGALTVAGHHQRFGDDQSSAGSIGRRIRSLVLLVPFSHLFPGILCGAALLFPQRGGIRHSHSLAASSIIVCHFFCVREARRVSADLMRFDVTQKWCQFSPFFTILFLFFF